MADLLEGNDSVGFEDYCEDVYNSTKNHWRQSNPVGNLSGVQPGMIVSDSDDEKLYHITEESPPYDEILQATNSFDVIPYFLGVDLWSGAYHHIIRASQAEGLAGADLRIGLDESLRTLIICDRGDIDVDFGNVATSVPIIRMFNAAATKQCYWYQSNTLAEMGSATAFRWQATGALRFSLFGDLNAGNLFRFESTAGSELTDTNAEQAWAYFEAKINQTLTAGYIGILLDVTETNLGDASAGAGYNALMDLRVAGTTQFGIQNDGKIMTNQAIPCESGGCVPGTIIHEMPIYDGDGNLLGYIAIYDAL